jgi:cell division protein FtsB
MNRLFQWTYRFPIIRNKYFLTVVVFLSWIMFFDKNDLISQYEDRQALYELQKEKHYYQEEIISTRRKLDELLSDSKSLEKFAREQYHMKKPNEEIWLVIDNTPKSVKK